MRKWRTILIDAVMRGLSPVDVAREQDAPVGDVTAACDRHGVVLAVGWGHWTPQRKIRALNNAKRTSIEAAALQYGVEIAELRRWSELYREHGVKGLSIRKMQSVQRRTVRA